MEAENEWDTRENSEIEGKRKGSPERGENNATRPRVRRREMNVGNHRSFGPGFSSDNAGDGPTEFSYGVGVGRTCGIFTDWADVDKLR